MRLDHLLSREQAEAGRRRLQPRSNGPEGPAGQAGETAEKGRRSLKRQVEKLIPYRFQVSPKRGPERARKRRRILTTAEGRKESRRPVKVGRSRRRHRNVGLRRVIKRRRAQGGCQGTKRRRRTRPAAKSCGESQADIDPQISEWGNPTENSSVTVRRIHRRNGGNPGN